MNFRKHNREGSQPTHEATVEFRSSFSSDGETANSIREGLFFRIFRDPTSEEGLGHVVAFTSAHSGAGVTEITKALADGLRDDGDPIAISISCRALIADGSHTNRYLDVAESTQILGEKCHWSAEQTLLINTLQTLRRQYKYVLVDCGPVNGSQDIARLAPLVDGIVLVVEANRTRREQILYAQRTIEDAKGRVVGCVLNKRTYPIPAFFHRVLGSVGI